MKKKKQRYLIKNSFFFFETKNSKYIYTFKFINSKATTTTIETLFRFFFVLKFKYLSFLPRNSHLKYLEQQQQQKSK